MVKMVRVMATGVFDILHPGHLHYLEEARELGDELVVVVARDSTVRKLKREPVIGEESRRQMVAALRPVDHAILGSSTDMFDTVELVRPDIIALGFNQRWDEREIERKCAARGVKVKVVRVGGNPQKMLSTKDIIGRIRGMKSGGMA